ncbi:MAG: hypothetical protein HOO06_09480 [Bdellovibrionaceae bacterium]|jgi:hypothetical protein|nr:hypothetical protein [Pseudobdellovibrionaceae bacterium]
MNKKPKSLIKDITGSYILEKVFEDIHEYEVYFEFSNSDKLDKLSPNKFRVKFKLNGRQQEFHYPDNERVIELIIPIKAIQNNPHTKAKLTKKYFDEYCDFIPKVRLALKNQIAANNKIIGTSSRIEGHLKKAVKKKRTSALRRAKKIIE